MIDIASEELIPLARVPDLIPSRRADKRLNQATVWRWTSRGSRGILLEAVTIGGSRYTSLEAVARFVERLSGDQAGRAGAPSGRTPAQRKRDSERAEKALAAGA